MLSLPVDMFHVATPPWLNFGVMDSLCDFIVNLFRLKAEAASRDGDDYSKDRYGLLPLFQSQEKSGRKWIEVRLKYWGQLG